MEQCREVRPSIAHQGYFEAGVERSGALWFQVVWDKFWDEMLPGLRDAWAEKRVDKHRVTAMPFSRSEVQKVLEDYKDAESEDMRLMNKAQESRIANGFNWTKKCED